MAGKRLELEMPDELVDALGAVARSLGIVRVEDAV